MDLGPSGAISVGQVVILDQLAIVVLPHDSPRYHRPWRFKSFMLLRLAPNNETGLRDMRNAQKMLLNNEVDAKVHAMDSVPRLLQTGTVIMYYMIRRGARVGGIPSM